MGCSLRPQNSRGVLGKPADTRSLKGVCIYIYSPPISLMGTHGGWVHGSLFFNVILRTTTLWGRLGWVWAIDSKSPIKLPWQRGGMSLLDISPVLLTITHHTGSWMKTSVIADGLPKMTAFSVVLSFVNAVLEDWWSCVLGLGPTEVSVHLLQASKGAFSLDAFSCLAFYNICYLFLSTLCIIIFFY